MYLTSKQLEAMRVIVDANPDGTPTDLDQIIERLSYKPTKDSFQFTLRTLIKHELIKKVGTENRRDRRRVLIAATDLGKHFAPPKTPAFVSSVEEEELLGELGVS